MRDPERIPLVLEEIRKYWKRCPDLRLGQLLWALAGRDPFYMEDDELVRRIQEEMEKK
jgi:hypothetical protein